MAARQLLFREEARARARQGVGTPVNTGGEPAIEPERLSWSRGNKSRGSPAKAGTCSELLQIGVIAPAKLTRPRAGQNAGQIAHLVRTIDCLIGNAPHPEPVGAACAGAVGPAI